MANNYIFIQVHEADRTNCNLQIDRDNISVIHFIIGHNPSNDLQLLMSELHTAKTKLMWTTNFTVSGSMHSCNNFHLYTVYIMLRQEKSHAFDDNDDDLEMQ